MPKFELTVRVLTVATLLAAASAATAAESTTPVCVKDCASADARKPKTQINPGDRDRPQVQAQQPGAVQVQQQPGAPAAAHTHEGHAPDAPH